MSTIESAVEMLQELGSPYSELMPALEADDFVKIEKLLGAALPPSYCYFLLHARSFGLHFEEFLWPNTDCDLVETNLEEREEGLPDFYISFLSDGYGTQVCFDTRSKNANEEYFIIEWERGMQNNDSYIEPIAEDFSSWLVARLEYEVEELQNMSET